MDDLRLQRLERRVRVQGAAIVGLMLTLGVVGLAGAGKDLGTQRAARFVIVDAEGRERGLFGLGKSGDPALTLNGTDEEPRIHAFASQKEGTLLSLVDTKGRERVGLAIHPDGGAEVAVNGPKDSDISLIGADDLGVGIIASDPKGKARFEVHVDGNGELTRHP